MKVGSEVDFSVDGGGAATKIKTRNKSKKLPKSASSSSRDREKKKANRKTGTPHCQTANDILLERFELVISATSDYIVEKAEDMCKLKNFGSITPKSVKDLEKLELLNDNLKRQKSLIVTTKQSLVDGKSLSCPEDDISSMYGVLRIGISRILGFSALKIGDHCDAIFLCGSEKHKLKGCARAKDDVVWNQKEIIVQPLSGNNIVIKIFKSKVFGKPSIGSTVVETKSFIKAGTFQTNLAMDKDGITRITFSHTWMPFDFNDIPASCHKKSSRDNLDELLIRGNKEDVMLCDRKVEENAASSKNTPGDSSLLADNELLDQAFLDRMKDNAKSINLNKHGSDPHRKKSQAVLEPQEKSKEVWAKALCVAVVLDFVLDSYRGRYEEMQCLETITKEIIAALQRSIDGRDSYLLNNLKFEIESSDNLEDFLKENQVSYKKIAANFPKITFDGDLETVYKAIIAHMRYSMEYLKDIGNYGPLKVREILALHRLKYQGHILRQIMDVVLKPDFDVKDIPGLAKRRTLLEFWRSCCDGDIDLCVSVKVLLLEFECEFGREMKKKHSDVATKIFPELIRRILGLPVSEMNDHVMTIFQLLQFCQEMESDGQIEDLAKTVDKLGLEMFLTSTLRSKNNDLILMAIKKVGTLLALRTSNLCALAHLLLNQEKAVRSAAAAHIIHIGKGVSLRDKALISYVELLESSIKRDRQSSCVALGFLGAKECIPQLSFLYQSDVDIDVREAAAHALDALGDEGRLSLEHVASTLLVQTMAQRVTLKASMRLGTAL